MTGNAFLKRLMFQLDFLNENDKKTVLCFYEKKLQEADTLLEEESIVKGFGSPDHIAQKLKEAFLSQSAAAEETGEEDSDSDIEDSPSEDVALMKSDSDEDIATENQDEDFETDNEIEPLEEVSDNSSSVLANDDHSITECSETDVAEYEPETQEESDEDLIFSKPATIEKAPEIIHSMDDKETKTLFGEKVVIRDRETPIDEVVLEAIDEENGLTKEEIDAAKAETLEKANKYRTESFLVPKEINPKADDESDDPVAEEGGIPSSDFTEGEPEKEEAFPDEDSEKELESPKLAFPNDEESEGIKEDTESEPIKTVPGIFKKMFVSLSPRLSNTLTILLSLLISPILVLLFGAGTLIYLTITVITLFFSLVLFALIAALIVLGVIELVYGVAMLFETVSVALIEIGLGTVLFSLVVAVAALIYEFFFGILPKGVKFFTRQFVRYCKSIYKFLYGGKA